LGNQGLTSVFEPSGGDITLRVMKHAVTTYFSYT